MIRCKVVSWKNVPTRLPGATTVIVLLVLDRLHAPGWAWGAAIVFLVIFWIAAIVAMCTEERTEIWPD